MLSVNVRTTVDTGPGAEGGGRDTRKMERGDRKEEKETPESGTRRKIRQEAGRGGETHPRVGQGEGDAGKWNEEKEPRGSGPRRKRRLDDLAQQVDRNQLHTDIVVYLDHRHRTVQCGDVAAESGVLTIDDAGDIAHARLHREKVPLRNVAVPVQHVEVDLAAGCLNPRLREESTTRSCAYRGAADHALFVVQLSVVVCVAEGHEKPGSTPVTVPQVAVS